MSTALKIGPDFDKLSWCFKSTNVLMIVIIDSSPKIKLIYVRFVLVHSIWN